MTVPQQHDVPTQPALPPVSPGLPVYSAVGSTSASIAGATGSLPPGGGQSGPLPDGSGICAMGLTKQYQRGQTTVPALTGIDLVLPRGSQVAVMGPSGSGKTTLLQCVAGVLRPTSGSIVIEGTQIVGMPERQLSRLRLEHFGFVFQDGQLLPELSNEENVALPLMLARTARRAAVDRARQVLGWMGLDGLGAYRPGQLSGGQVQRVAIARALVASPQVVFADEPTGALDQTTGHEVMDILTSACRASGATLVLVTHDPGVAGWFPTTIHMRDGNIVEDEASAGEARAPVVGKVTGAPQAEASGAAR